MAYGDGFSIADFKGQINNGLLKPNLYQVKFNAAASRGSLSQQLRFYTDAVNIPSVDLDSQMIRRYGYGPMEYVPYRPVFGPIGMSFMVEASQVNILSDVLNAISSTTPFMNYNTLNDEQPLFGAGVGYPYEVAYKGDLEFDLEIDMYNEAGDTIVTVTLQQCYVKQIGSINLAWASNDQYLKVDVTLIPVRYSISTSDAPSDGNQTKSGIGSQQFGTAGVPQHVQDVINKNAGATTTAPAFNTPPIVVA